MARGVGATLQSLGQGVQQDAMSTLGAAAEQESRRSMQNQQLEQQQKAGRVQLGTTLGTLGGFAAGAMLNRRRRCACRVCQWACGHGGWRFDRRHRWRHLRRPFD